MDVRFKRVGFGAMLAVFAASGASAGELLRLSGGTVRLGDRSEWLLSQSVKAPRRPVAAGQRQRMFVIQFDGAITAADQAAIAARGLEALRYLPDDVLLVRGDAAAAATAKGSLPGVRAVAAVEPDWKISTDLAGAAGPKARLMVSAYDRQELPGVLAEARQVPGVTAVLAEGRDLVVDADLSRVTELARIEGVEWIQELPIFTSLDFEADAAPAAVTELSGYESGTKIMGFEAAWSRGYKGAGQIAAVADTGLDVGIEAQLHSDFQGSIHKAYVMGLGGKSWADPQGHGTHVMGSVVGRGTASGGAFKGGAHEAKLVAEGMWSAILNNIVPPTNMDKLMGVPYRDGARVHSDSWGSPQNLGAYDAFAVRMDEAAWNSPEMLLIFAAGNSGADADRDGRIDPGSVGTPSTAKNVLTVGASENFVADGGNQKMHYELRNGEQNWGVEPIRSDRLSNDPNGIAAFSSRGPTRDGRLKPDVVAPGTNIVSARSRHKDATVLWGEYDANYVWAGGTSMATPLTAGAASVARQYLVEARGFKDPTSAVLKALLIHTATDLFPGQYGRGPKQELESARPNVHEGYGRVNVDAATALEGGSLVEDDRAGLGTGDRRAFAVRVEEGRRLRATLVYTDAPGAAAAAKALVNDLDLEVRNVATGEVVAKGDRLNNVEMIELPPGAGEYEVAVKGVSVPRGRAGKQPFALIVTGG